MIFGINPGNVSRETHVVELVTFWFSWGCILASILYAVRPWLLRPVSHASDLMHAHPRQPVQPESQRLPDAGG